MKPKVTMLGHKVVPSRRGGIENVLTTLCPLLVERGVDVTCRNRASDKVENEYVGTVKDGMYKGVRLKKSFTLNMRGASAAIAAFSAAIGSLFDGCDIAHFHAEGPCVALWIPKLFGKKCVATVHGLDWQREKWGKGFASKFIKLGERTLVRFADEVIVLSESAQSYFLETYGRKTVVIPNGAPTPVFRDASNITKLYGLEKDSYICMVSRLTAEKGVHYLIEAYKKAKASIGKKLVIAGDTSDTDDYVASLKEMARGDSDIIFTGFISGETLDELYSNAYAVCLPSDIEGMALGLLEALAYGNAVICSDIPENTSVAEDFAVYFKKGDVDDLSEKLRYICTREGAERAAKLKSGAGDFIRNKYNWNKVADMTCDIYFGLTNKNRAGGKEEKA